MKKKEEKKGTILLIRRYQSGDREALQELIFNYNGLVLKVLKSFLLDSTSSVSYDDLYHEGIIGFINAVKNYNYSGCLSTYAFRYIRGAMLDALKKEPLVERKQYKLKKQADVFIEDYIKKYGEYPTNFVIAEALHVSLDAIKTLYLKIASLDDSIFDDESLIDLIVSSEEDVYASAEKRFFSKEISCYVDKAKLTPIETVVLKCRYYDGYAPADVALRFKISLSDVIALEKKALNKLKDVINNDAINREELMAL